MSSFNMSPVAVIKAREADSDNILTIPGVTAANTTPENAATQINKILSVCEKTVTPYKMIRSFTEEATDNG